MLTDELLIRKGFFPQEILPSFTTASLATKLTSIKPVLRRHYDNTRRPNNSEKYTSKNEQFTIPKTHTTRRVISIPNPLHQILLAETIATNWNAIQTFTSSSTLSQSPLTLSDPTTGTRCFTKIDFHNGQRKLYLANASRYLLKFDITRFYSSIYTHSIAWAIHTKAVAKTNHSRSLYGNAIDTDVRNTQDAQTNGIPVGPDTSRAIAEIISTAIDISLTTAMKNIKGVRYVDDYFLFFPNYKQLEEANSIIHSCLAEYHLDFNNAKFKIIELPEPLMEQWTASLGKFNFRGTPKQQEFDLFQFFSLAFEYAKSYPNDYVLSYAVSRFQTIIVNRSVWHILESFLLHTLFVESKTIRYVCNIFIAYKQALYPIDTQKLEEFLNAFISLHKDKGQPFEIAWACWLAKQLGIKLSRETTKILSSQNNSLVAITALDLQRSKLLDGRLDTNNWKALCTVDNLYSDNWLLVYEAVKRRWLRQNSNFFDADPFFKSLKDNNVSFYDASRTSIGRRIVVSAVSTASQYPF